MCNLIHHVWLIYIYVHVDIGYNSLNLLDIPDNVIGQKYYEPEKYYL